MWRRHRRSAGHIFSVMAEKIWKKRPLGREIALARLKAVSFRSAFCRYTFHRQNALRAGKAIPAVVTFRAINI